VPTIVVIGRKAPNIGQVVVVNFFLGWTFVGWVVALVMALKPKPQMQPYPPPFQAPPPPYEPPPYGRPGGFGTP
jgi:Superinfection immunity protein